MLLLVNNVVQKMRTRVTNNISLYNYKLTNVYFINYLYLVSFKFLTLQKYFLKMKINFEIKKVLSIS